MPVSAIGATGVEQLIKNEQGAALPIPGNSDKSENGMSFGQMLSNAIGDVNSLQQNSGDLVKRYSAGERMDVHQVMIAMEQATTSLALTTQVRNKVVDAYQEIMRTQV